jgi:hypothetical protein
VDKIHAKDKTGAILNVGDAVAIDSIPDGLVDELPEEEAVFLESSIRTTAIITNIVDKVCDNNIEVELFDNTNGIVHFVWLNGGCLIKS